MDHMVAASEASVELMEEDDEKENEEVEDVEEGSSSEDLVPKQATFEVEENNTTLVQRDGAMVE